MALILSRSELERIRNSARPDDETPPPNPAAVRRAELKQKSTERVQHWPNTLEATRKKKESFLKEKAEHEELQRQEIDRQEAEHARTLRLETIKRANELLYAQTDKMKLLRSQILYADVVHERVSQAEQKKKRREAEKAAAMKHHEEILHQVAAGEVAEKAKLAKQQGQVEEVKVVRYQQREEARQIREEIARKNKEEGLRLKTEAQARIEEDLRDFEAKQKLAAESNARMIKANEDLKVIRTQLREQERQAEAARDVEVEKIEYRKKMLKHLEKVRFEKAQETRQKIIDAAVEQLRKKTSTEQAILDKQMQDIRDREDKELADKMAMLAKQKADIDAGRIAQMAARDEQARRDREEEDAMLLRWRLENEEAMRLEKEKEVNARKETIRIKQIQWDDAHERARKKEEEKMLEIEQARFLNSIDGSDDTQFVELCKAEIEKNIRLGKPVYTLLRALEYSQPMLIPAKLNKKKDHPKEDK